MNNDHISRYWKIVFGGTRVFAFLLMIVSLGIAISIGSDENSRMDAGLKWGLVALFTLVSVLGFLMLRAPIRRKR
jgi:hypothetical protein